MPLKGRDYLIATLCCAAVALWLWLNGLPSLFAKLLPTDDHEFILFMAMSVLSLWSSVKFLFLNRRQRDTLYFLLVLVPIILVSLYVIFSYIFYFVYIYHRIHTFNAHYLVQ